MPCITNKTQYLTSLTFRWTCGVSCQYCKSAKIKQYQQNSRLSVKNYFLKKLLEFKCPVLQIKHSTSHHLHLDGLVVLAARIVKVQK